MKKYLLVLPLAAMLAACGGKHDVAYYKAHTDERDTKVAECRNQAGAFDNDKECINAALADDVRPVSYWKDNGEERKVKLAECKEHGATIGKSENCENAGRAAAATLGGGKPVYVPVGK
jgi:hypothetical protein